jgi:hypothetical protein
VAIAGCALAVLYGAPKARASVGTVIDFEGRTNGEPITNQYSSQGVTFAGNSGAAPTILDPSPAFYPAHSGTAVLWKPVSNPNDTPNAPIVATFTNPEGAVSAYVSNGYGSTTLTAYNSANTQVATATAPGPNYQDGGSIPPPNALLAVNDPDNTIVKVVFTSSADGSDFVIDDLTFGPAPLNTYYTDADHDGYGDAGSPVYDAHPTPPAGAVADATDCDDADANTHPGAPEICDNKDNNCNGSVDEGLITTTTAIVSSDAWNGWATVAQRTGTGDFTYGPGTPPLGSGSFKFSTGAGNSGPDLPQGGAGTGGKVWLSTQLYDGMLLADIRALSYSTYVEQRSDPNVTPTLQFQVDWDNDGIRDNAFVFEPIYSSISNGGSQPNPATGTWQTWDALNGRWWYTGVSNSNPHAATLQSFFNKPFADSGGVNPLSYYLATYPNAKIITWYPLTDGYGTQFQAGQNSAGAPWANFVGDVDNFTIGVNCDEGVYDFEMPATTYYQDTDTDGYGDPNSTYVARTSTPPAGYVANGMDCNDADPNIHPGAYDIPGNGIDEDCNGCDATAPATQTVTPTALNGWTVATDTAGATPVTANVDFVAGPATAPIGTGSIHFTVGSNGDSYGIITNPNYNGVKLKDLDTLKYST